LFVIRRLEPTQKTAAARLRGTSMSQNNNGGTTTTTTTQSAKSDKHTTSFINGGATLSDEDYVEFKGGSCVPYHFVDDEDNVEFKEIFLPFCYKVTVKIQLIYLFKQVQY